MHPNIRAAAIETVLRQALSPRFLAVRDDSHHHIGHASAGGAGHFHVSIVSEQFAGLSRVARHRLIFSLLADLMGTDVHALSIDAKSVGETYGD